MAVEVYAPRAVDAARKAPEDVARRVWELRDLHSDDLVLRRRIRDICNGGTAGMVALLGDLPRNTDSVAAANLILSGITRAAQQLGQAPTVRVDVPTSGAGESERARKAAERRERIVSGYDTSGPAPLELQLPQQARWLIGYGFASWVVREAWDAEGYRMPHAELRDPIDTFPGPWGVAQQPPDVAYLRRVTRRDLRSIYPSQTTAIYRDAPSRRMGGRSTVPMAVAARQGVGVGQSSGQWEGTDSDDASLIEVCEYHDAWGCRILLADGTPLDAYPTPLRSGPAFVFVKRFAFDKLAGQFDQAIGLLAGMARLSILAEIATRDAVFAETIVTGRVDHEWRRGRNAVNIIEGGDAKKLLSNLPYQMFTEIDRIERNLRVTAGYSAQSDGESPTSFATGRGLNELASGTTFELREYQVAMRHALQFRDARLLEWDDLAYPEQTRRIEGSTDGAAFSETYTPSRHIKGNYITRRAYGAMAGFDDYQKLVAGLQLMSAGVISKLTMQENIAGLENLSRENDRIRAEQVESTLFGMLMSGQPVDPRVPLTLAELMPASALKDTLLKYWTPNEPEMNPAEDALINGPPPPEGPVLPEAPPDVTTALSLMRANGTAGGGVQTVSTA